MYHELLRGKARVSLKTLRTFTSMLREKTARGEKKKKSRNLTLYTSRIVLHPSPSLGSRFTTSQLVSLPVPAPALQRQGNLRGRRGDRKEAAWEALRPRRKGFEKEKEARIFGGMRPGGQRLMGTGLERATAGQGKVSEGPS